MATYKSEIDDSKHDSYHVEDVAGTPRDLSPGEFDDLDSIEKTQSGGYAWLVAITAGVGGLLFGEFLLR